MDLGQGAGGQGKGFRSAAVSNMILLFLNVIPAACGVGVLPLFH
jgi:hypothetical protein